MMLTTFFVDGALGDDAYPGTEAEPFATIQRGIDEAAATTGDDDIQVAIGSYQENLTINDTSGALTLRGTGGATAGVAVQGGGADVIWITLTNDVTIENLTVANGDRGIFSYGAAHLTLDDVSATGNAKAGVLHSNVWPGIEQGDLTIVGGSFSLNQTGIVVRLGNNVEVTGSAAWNNDGSGILIESAANVTLTDVSALENASRAVFVNDADTVEVEGGLFQNNQAGGPGFNEVGQVAIAGAEILNNSVYGKNGGGILVTGQSTNLVTITDSTIVGNKATYGNGGGVHIAAEGVGLIENCLIAQNEAKVNGGGIYVRFVEELVVRNSTIVDNSALGVDTAPDSTGFGGGIYQGADLTVESSTLARNTAPTGGAGIASFGSLLSDGYGDDYTTNVSNSTFSANTTEGEGGAILMAGNVLNVDSSTITLNAAESGGGIARLYSPDGTATIGNTIIAANTVTGLAFTTDVSGFFISEGYNLVGMASPNSGFNGPGDLVGPENGPPIDPMLADLEDNGGPTPTHALLDGSPAIDAGMTPLAVDQRGKPRPGFGTASADVGAFEFQLPGVYFENGVLRITGTDQNDVVAVTKAKKGRMSVEASFLPGGAVSFKKSEVRQIVVYLLAGDDQWTSQASQPTVVHGGDGTDVLRAGGTSVLLGDGGDDFLYGGKARDILIGGDGSDVLVGGRGDDVLIGGTTSYNTNDAALLAILAEWNSGLRYADRVAALGDDVGYTLQKGETVFDDESLDVLTGAQGNDWFFFDPDKDDVTDKKNKEVGN